MKTLLETVSTILFVAALLAMIFLFRGTPSLWDKLHDYAMGMCK